MLSKSVLVKGVNNLSDARYCAGMGVDFVAFELDPTDANYLEPAKIKEIKNWLVGLKIGVRVTTCEDVSIEAIKEIKPSFLIVSEQQFKEGDFTADVFVESNKLINLPKEIKLLWLTNKERLTEAMVEFNSDIYVDLEDGAEALKELIEEDFKGGLSLNGGNESRPGNSDFGDLIDVLELLDD